MNQNTNQLSIQGMRSAKPQRHYKMLSVATEFRKRGVKYSWVSRNGICAHSDLLRPSFFISMDVTDVPGAMFQIEYYKVVTANINTLLKPFCGDIRIFAVSGAHLLGQLYRFGFVGKEVANVL